VDSLSTRPPTNVAHPLIWVGNDSVAFMASVVLQPLFAPIEDYESSAATVRWTELAGKILVCSRMLREQLSRRADRQEISEGELFLLWACRKAPPMGAGQSQLAESIAVSPAHISGLVEQLRKKGLLEPRRDPADRRRQLWRISPAGYAAIKTVLDDLTDWAGEIQAKLGNDGDRVLGRLIEELIDVLRDRSAGPAKHRGAA